MELRTIACRCQLLIGSWEGNPYACPCKEPAECCLTRMEREELKKDPRVKDALRRSQREYWKKNPVCPHCDVAFDLSSPYEELTVGYEVIPHIECRNCKTCMGCEPYGTKENQVS